MHLFERQATFEADPDAVRKVWTDAARWPEWDVSKGDCPARWPV